MTASSPRAAPPLPSADGVWEHLHLAPEALGEGMPALRDAAIVVDGGQVHWVGPRAQLPASYAAAPRHDGQGAQVTPGLVDCHTHLVYGGQRANEFAMRLAGASYEEVARAGGGIVSSVRATREADEDSLLAQALPRLQALLDEGVCAIEIKSGYGLDLANERKQLRVARRLGQTLGVTVRTTFLGAHALPPEYAGRSGDYIRVVCEEMMPTLAAEGLIDAVDAFCERIGFSLTETEQVFQAAQRLGLPVKLAPRDREVYLDHKVPRAISAMKVQPDHRVFKVSKVKSGPEGLPVCLDPRVQLVQRDQPESKVITVP